MFVLAWVAALMAAVAQSLDWNQQPAFPGSLLVAVASAAVIPAVTTLAWCLRRRGGVATGLLLSLGWISLIQAAGMVASVLVVQNGYGLVPALLTTAASVMLIAVPLRRTLTVVQGQWRLYRGSAVGRSELRQAVLHSTVGRMMLACVPLTILAFGTTQNGMGQPTLSLLASPFVLLPAVGYALIAVTALLLPLRGGGSVGVLLSLLLVTIAQLGEALSLAGQEQVTSGSLVVIAALRLALAALLGLTIARHDIPRHPTGGATELLRQRA